MSRRSRLPSPPTGSLAAFLSAAILSLAAPVHARTDRPVGALDPARQRYPLCSGVLEAREGGFLQTAADPATSTFVTTGLWVGAEADRGQGPEQIVSEAPWAFEFWPVDPTALPGSVGGARFFYADTSTAIVPHEPLGLRVVQIGTAGTRPGYGGFVRFRFEVKNISASYRPPGWDLDRVYLGMFADPDVGQGAASGYWQDDLAAYQSTAGGGLAYAWDAPGHGDDTAERVGLLLPEQEAHSFQVWSYEDDPADDAARYALLRGDGDDVQTIDPPATAPSDQRILVSVGPFSLPRGASRSFVVAVVCGDALPPTPAVLAARDGSAAPSPSLVMPNPVRRGGPGLRFAGLPSGARVSVYQTSGRLVTTLVTDVAGDASWDLLSRGERVSAGVYLYRVDGPARTTTGKIVVVR
ncbi:MAG: T9SS type A sorting domain-containing protein [bacterium]